MTKKDLEETRLRDALSDVTRKERHFLLGTSLLGIALVKTGLVPSKIAGLGVEFQAADQRTLLAIVAFVIFYFFLAFIIYAASDFLAWRLAIIRHIIDSNVARTEEDYSGYFPQPGSVEDVIEKLKVEFYTKFRIQFRLVTPISIIRVLFDVGLPIAVGGYSLFLLIRGAIGNST
ncbi:MAG: hypothetical protein LUQ65_00270 [Candidatus Helarchaeota archaeon]|nr:hypothetical protein [Candidatus Helarchaeota archaeon]